MGWFLFVDESGTDGKFSPYEVFAGVAVEDRVLWGLIQKIKQCQLDHFGTRLFDAYGSEAKGQKLLKTKVFKEARKKEMIDPVERRAAACQILRDGANPRGNQLIALAQSKISYVDTALSLCTDYGVAAFATIVPKEAERQSYAALRRDYAFLFERFYNFLDTQAVETRPMGTVIFDETEKTHSQRLIAQMDYYFCSTRKGRERSQLIIPEPLFVHSDLTTMIQIADLVAYIISWGVRLGGQVRPMTHTARPELENLAQRVLGMRRRMNLSDGTSQWTFATLGKL